MPRKKLHFVQSLSRGLIVLQAFSAERPALRLTEIAELTGLNMAATQRFTDTLMQLGFLYRNPHREFLLGPKVLSLGFAYLNGNQLKKLAQSALDEFGRKHQRTMNLAVLEGDHVIFLHRVESQRFLKYDLQAGSRLPSHCTATGKVLLAGQSDRRLSELIAGMRLERMTSRTIDDPQELWDDLMATRARGYSVSDREMSLALYSLGIPVLDQEGKVVAAINLSLSVEEARGRYLADMQHAFAGLGRAISDSLGYQGPYPVIPPAADEETGEAA